MLCTRPPVPSTKEQTGDAGRSSERLARLFGSSTNRTLPNSPLEAGEAPRGLRTATTSTSSPATASATRASARNSASHRSSLSMKATTAPTRSLSHGSRSSCANLHPQSSDGFFRASGAESERDKGRRLAASSAQNSRSGNSSPTESDSTGEAALAAGLPGRRFCGVMRDENKMMPPNISMRGRKSPAFFAGTRPALRKKNYRSKASAGVAAPSQNEAEESDE